MLNRILVFFLLFSTWPTAFLKAQQTLGDLIDRITQIEKKNVFRIEEKLRDKEGFGFIVGQQNNVLYIATAYHTVERDSNDQQDLIIRVLLRDNQVFEGQLVAYWPTPDDLALLSVKIPDNYIWLKECERSELPQQQDKVSFIAWNGTWKEYPIDHSKGEISLFDEKAPKINFTHPRVEPGASGSPLITENGIIGMIIEDQTSGSTALSIDRIKKLIGDNTYQLKPANLKPTMTLIPATETFKIGSNFGAKDTKPPAFPLKIDAFYLDKYELSVLEYEAFLKSTGRKQRVSNKLPDNPIVNISWLDAIDYCNWLSETKGYQPVYHKKDGIVTAIWGNNGYRLPTEAEWEYASKEEESKSSEKVKIVKEGTPNYFGLVNMMGNVAEWCWDYYSEQTYELIVPSNAYNPRGPEEGFKRIARGSTWADKSTKVYSRQSYRADAGYDTVGLRLARNAN